MLEKRFGFKDNLDYVFLMNNKNKLYITNNDFGKINTEKLRINNIGMYFGEIANNEIRLSIEGSQLIGRKCSKNILELDDNYTKQWLNGIDIDIDYKEKGYILLKSKGDFLGCGKAVNSKILNFIPKNRRVNVINCCD